MPHDNFIKRNCPECNLSIPYTGYLSIAICHHKEFMTHAMRLHPDCFYRVAGKLYEKRLKHDHMWTCFRCTKEVMEAKPRVYIKHNGTYGRMHLHVDCFRIVAGEDWFRALLRYVESPDRS